MSKHDVKHSTPKTKRSIGDAVREWVYLALGVFVSILLTISWMLATQPNSWSFSGLTSVAMVLLVVEGILLGLSPVLKEPYPRVAVGFLSLMGMLFSLDTLMLIGILSSTSGATVITPSNVLTPFSFSPLDLFRWNIGFFSASVISYLGNSIYVDLKQIRLKRAKPAEEKKGA